MADEKKDMTNFKNRVLDRIEELQNYLSNTYVGSEERYLISLVNKDIDIAIEHIQAMTQDPKPKEIGECISCGEMFLYEDMIFGPDPFDSEINDDDTEVWLCESCHHESGMDI